MRDVWDLANKNNVAIYAVDPRGLPTSEFDLSQPAVSLEVDRQYLNATMDTLRVLAEQTDGRAIVNRNDLAAGMRQIVRDTSAYYLLGYNSTQAPSDGKFHEIKVRVKRSGVQVRARRGYWALTATDVARALAPRVEPPKAVENALASISVSAAAHNTIRTWIGTSRGANGKTRVTLVWEPMPRVAGDRNARSEAPSRVMVTAAGPDGAPYFRGRVPEVAPPRRRRRSGCDWRARDVRGQPGQGPASPVGRRQRLSGARRRDARDCHSGSDRGGCGSWNAAVAAREDGARPSADQGES